MSDHTCSLVPFNCSVMSDSLRPHLLYGPWNSPGQNIGMGSLSLLQGVFPTQGSNPGLLHCRRILYQLCYEGSKKLNNDLHDPENHDGVVTHLEPDILECEVKWALGSITMNKASGGDDIPVELFQILKDDAVKVLHSICQQVWKTAVATGLEKVSFHSNSKERQCQRMLKLPHSCTHLTG